ncbi:MAG: HD domain-containing protein [Desulfobacterales bacterium]
MAVDPIAVIRRFYNPESRAFAILVEHGIAVSEKAVNIARRITGSNPDIPFIWEAAMLHDIGIFLTNTSQLDCHGKHPYIRHGILGARILKKLELHRHARVCECHLGMGIRAAEITAGRLPLPVRDMVPETLEEQIICYADKFFSKNGGYKNEEKSISTIIEELQPLGDAKIALFHSWMERFEC